MKLGRVAFHRGISSALIVALSLGLIGCEASNRDAAAAIARHGEEFSTETATSLSTTRDQLEQTIEARLLLQGIDQLAAHNPEQLAKIESVKEALRARADMLSNLGNVYASLGHLAAYNASSEVASSLKDFVSAANSYGKAVGAGENAVPPVASELIQIAGSELATQAQNKALKQASKAIRERLLRVQDLMLKEAPIIISIRKEIIDDNVLVVTRLTQKGFGDPSPIFKSHFGQLGIDYNRDSTLKAIAANPAPFYAAIESVAQRRAEQNQDAQVAILQLTMNVISDLIAEHTKLENGQSNDLSTLTERIARLRGYIERVSNALNPPATSGS